LATEPDDWDGQMLFFLTWFCRVIATTARHGRSTQTSDGPLTWIITPMIWSALTAHLDLRRGSYRPLGPGRRGGTIPGRHGESRVANAVIIGAVRPLIG